MRRWPIRAQITAVACAVFALVFGGTAVAITAVQRVQLTRSLDATLEQRSDEIATLLGDGVAVEVFGASEQESFVQVLDSDGSVVASTANMEGHPPIGVDLPDGVSKVFTTTGSLSVDDDVFRVITRRVSTADDTALLHVGLTYDEVADSLSVLTISLAVALPLVVVLLGALVWWLVGRTLRPVERIRAEVAEIGAGALDSRIEAPVAGDEIGRLATTMNEMLERLEQAVERQQEFVADASHELRSPLTRLRTNLEVDAASLDPSPGRDALGHAIASVVELQELIEDLLHLARSDAGAVRASRIPTDLDDIVLAEVARIRDRSKKVFDVSRVSAAHLAGDPAHLSRLVRNLVENAERHAETRVELTCTEDDQWARLVVVDDGPGIAPEDRSRVFDRFTRLDGARAREAGGTGLGLAIARTIAEQHGGSLSIDDRDGITRFVAMLPRAPDVA